MGGGEAARLVAVRRRGEAVGGRAWLGVVCGEVGAARWRGGGVGGGEGAVASQSESGLDGEGCGGDQGPRPQGWGSSTRSLRPLSDVCGVLEARTEAALALGGV